MTKLLSLHKHGLLAVTLGAFSLTFLSAETSAPSAAAKSVAYYQKALKAESDGDAVTAMAAYQAALKLNPRNANARYRMGQLKKNYKKVAAKGREAEFGSVVVPEFKVQNAELMESLVALAKIVETESDGKIIPNFVIQDPDRILKDTKVSLVLKGVPARGVLNYLLEQAGAKARYDKYAVVIVPR